MSSASFVIERCSDMRLSQRAWKAVVWVSTALKEWEREERRVRVEAVLASRESRWRDDSWSCSWYRRYSSWLSRTRSSSREPYQAAKSRSECSVWSAFKPLSRLFFLCSLRSFLACVTKASWKSLYDWARRATRGDGGPAAKAWASALAWALALALAFISASSSTSKMGSVGSSVLFVSCC